MKVNQSVFEDPIFVVMLQAAHMRPRVWCRNWLEIFQGLHACRISDDCLLHHLLTHVLDAHIHTDQFCATRKSRILSTSTNSSSRKWVNDIGVMFSVKFSMMEATGTVWSIRFSPSWQKPDIVHRSGHAPRCQGRHHGSWSGRCILQCFGTQVFSDCECGCQWCRCNLCW